MKKIDSDIKAFLINEQKLCKDFVLCREKEKRELEKQIETLDILINSRKKRMKSIEFLLKEIQKGEE